MNLDYKAQPDLSLRPLTVDSVALFQRFQQVTDSARADRLFSTEVNRHLRLCELAIMRAARSRYYWCELPEHPMLEVTIAVDRRLKAVGFKTEHKQEAEEESVPHRIDKNKILKAVRVTDRWTASWLGARPRFPSKLAREWRRREKLEREARRRYVPRPKSRIEGDKVIGGSAVWSAMLDKQYLVEVQNIYHQNMLCVFTSKGEFLHSEPTNLSYGAMFGPDDSDVADWEARAVKFVDKLKSRPTKRRRNKTPDPDGASETLRNPPSDEETPNGK